MTSALMQLDTTSDDPWNETLRIREAIVLPKFPVKTDLAPFQIAELKSVFHTTHGVSPRGGGVEMCNFFITAQILPGKKERNDLIETFELAAVASR
ncbi:MAG TPA: hypothetical protein VKR52_05355 [Terracidiphilus sp.]|nr:hypothetical protein [Terracidiphilus sp.]